MRNLNCIALSAADTASQNGPAMDTNQWIAASFQAVFGDATAAGTFKLQASNDTYNDRYNYPQGTFTPTNWTDIPNQTASITSGGSAILTIPQCAYRWIRAVYTRSGGGSTTIIVNVNALSM